VWESAQFIDLKADGTFRYTYECFKGLGVFSFYYSVFWVITRRLRKFDVDVSGLPIGPIFKGKPLCSPETSVSNYLTSRNNPEDGRVQFNFGGSLRYRILSVVLKTSKKETECTN
jgi:hypothetical protein